MLSLINHYKHWVYSAFINNTKLALCNVKKYKGGKTMNVTSVGNQDNKTNFKGFVRSVKNPARPRFSGVSFDDVILKKLSNIKRDAVDNTKKVEKNSIQEGFGLIRNDDRQINLKDGTVIKYDNKWMEISNCDGIEGILPKNLFMWTLNLLSKSANANPNYAATVSELDKLFA